MEVETIGRFRNQFLLKLFLLFFFYGFVNESFIKGQDLLKSKYVCLEANSISLAKLLLQIKNQTGINFCYKHDSLSNISVTLSKIKRIRVDSLLNMFRPELNYKLINGQIVIYKQKKGSEILELSLTKHVKQLEKKNEATALLFTNTGNLKFERKTITLYDTIIKTIVDTVYTTLFDTIKVTVKDTVYEKVISTPIKSKQNFKPKYELEFYVTSLFTIIDKFSAITPLYYQQTDSINQAQNSSWGFSSGFAINLNYRNWYIRSGLGYGLFNTNFNYIRLDENINPRDYWNKFPKIIKKDTIIEWYVLLPDSIWVPVHDSILSTVLDSTLKTTYDTTHFSNRLKTSNKLHYIMVPISAGYCFKVNKRFDISVGVGILTCILIGTKGKTYSNQNVVTDLKSEDYNNFVLFFSGSIGLNYKMSRRLCLFTNLEYFTNLTNALKAKTQINDKHTYLGTTVGLKYIL
jgi:hypothetical protein